MGYSCTTKAMESFDQLIIQLRAAGKKIAQSNTWEKNGKSYFHEIGREQKDGAVTGTIYRMTDYYYGANHCCKAGYFRIEPDGKITRFPTATQKQKEVAEIAAKAKISKDNIFSLGAK